MAISVQIYLTNKIFVYYSDRTIRKLLKYVPQNHLMGLDKIVVVKSFNGRNKNDAALYKRKDSNRPALIEIAFYSVFHNKPLLFLLLPFVGKFLFASALYHEIGHHYHHSLQHGVKKKKSEKFAEDYKKDALKRALWGWRILLRPLAPFARYMAKNKGG